MYDRYSIAYHLTPDGWIAAGEGESAPVDCIETWLLEVTQRSMHSREESTWTRTWVDPESREEVIEIVRAKFEPPSGFPRQQRGTSAGAE